MKLVTHVLFSIGVALFLCRVFGFDFWTSAVIATAAGIMQYAIDSLSHERIQVRGMTVSRRTPLFHSPLGALTLPSVFTAMLAFMLRPDIEDAFKYLAVLLTASYLHLLLDLPTGRGIYVAGRRTWKREKFRYDDPLLNLIFSALGITLMLLSVR